MTRNIRLIGIDAGLRITGWGIVDMRGNRLIHVDNGIIISDAAHPICDRLVTLHTGLAEVIARYQPQEAAAEESFVNKNPNSTLKLGLARGAVLLAPALAGLPVTEYAPNRVKKTVVGVGHADKQQVQLMVGKLLPGCRFATADAADALAVAICHAHFTSAPSSPLPVSTGRRLQPADGLQKAIAAALAKETGR